MVGGLQKVIYAQGAEPPNFRLKPRAQKPGQDQDQREVYFLRARGCPGIIKVAGTIADPEKQLNMLSRHISQAPSWRVPNRRQYLISHYGSRYAQ